jgi:hypothetical protein
MRMVPELSNPPEEVVKIAPDFWQPKPVASAVDVMRWSGELAKANH